MLPIVANTHSRMVLANGAHITEERPTFLEVRSSDGWVLRMLGTSFVLAPLMYLGYVLLGKLHFGSDLGFIGLMWAMFALGTILAVYDSMTMRADATTGTVDVLLRYVLVFGLLPRHLHTQSGIVYRTANSSWSANELRIVPPHGRTIVLRFGKNADEAQRAHDFLVQKMGFEAKDWANRTDSMLG